MTDLAEPADLSDLSGPADLTEPAPAAAEPIADAPGCASALAARVAEYRRGQVVVDYANRGVPVPEIAARLGIPEGQARARLRKDLARALPETPEEFAALQMSRLNEALLVAYSAMGEMGLKAVDRVVRIVRALDRLHGVARPLAAAVAADAAEPAPVAAPSEGRRPAAPGARDALPPGEVDGWRRDRLRRRERNQTAPQPSEKAQNRSQSPDTSPGGLVGAVADLIADCAAALGERGDKRADAQEFAPVANLAAIRGGGASVHALAAAWA